MSKGQTASSGCAVAVRRRSLLPQPPHVTDVGLQHLSSLMALNTLYVSGTSTTQAGKNALKAALPALTIHG